MPKKRFRPADIIAKLKEADIPIGQGKTVAEAIKQFGVSDGTYYRWGQEYGGMTTLRFDGSKNQKRKISGCARQCRVSRWTR